MKESSADRIFGKFEAGKESARHLLAKEFKEQEYKYETERQKTKEELEIIAFVNEFTNTVATNFGGQSLDVQQKNVHVLDQSEIEQLDKIFSQKETTHPSSIFIASLQAIVMSDKKGDLLAFTRELVHEMCHFKAFQSLEVRLDPDRKMWVGKNRRGGLAIEIKRDKQKEAAFVDLNEAIIEQLTGVILENLTKSNDLPDALKKQIEKVPNEKREEKIFGAVYVPEQLRLIDIAEKIYGKNRDRFKNAGEVLRLFYKSMFSGELLQVARLIEKTFGKGSFKKIGEEGLPISQIEKEVAEEEK